LSELTIRHPCDTPLTPIEELKNSRDGIFAHLDFSTLSPEYASKEGIFDPKNANERARLVRRWIRDRSEDRIVGVFFCTNYIGGIELMGSRCAW